MDDARDTGLGGAGEAPRAAASHVLAGVRTLLATAYADDPLIRWLFDGVAEPAHASAAWLGVFAERYLAAGRVELVPAGDGLGAVALWRTGPAPAALPGLPQPGGLFTAFVGHERAETLGRALRVVAELAPAERHAYLHFLAVDPAYQRRGLGVRALGAVLADAALEGVGVHLETTNPGAVPFYEAQGFAVTAEVTLADGGPRMWGMRHARL